MSFFDGEESALLHPLSGVHTMATYTNMTYFAESPEKLVLRATLNDIGNLLKLARGHTSEHNNTAAQTRVPAHMLLSYAP